MNSTKRASPVPTYDDDEPIPLEAARLCTQVALLAACCGLQDEADAIVAGLEPALGDRPPVALAAVSVAAAGHRNAEALDRLERLMKRHPELSAVRCVTARFRKELGIPGWRALAEQVIAAGDDAHAVEQSRRMLAQGALPPALRPVPQRIPAL